MFGSTRGHMETVFGVSVASAALMASSIALAQTPQPQSSRDAGAAGLGSGEGGSTVVETEEIVVTGTTAGLRILDASFAITTLGEEEIEKIAPRSTADLLKIVPGIWAETAGGETGANIFVRGFPTTGDADFVTIAVDGVPLFPPPTLAFLENSSLYRIDETVARFEALRGGPNTVLSNGQPGVTINFIQKIGGPAFEGVLKGTVSDYDTRRIDGFIGGPLGGGHFFALGGFYRVSDGARNVGYDADKGGQISANLSGGTSGIEYAAYVRYLNDKNVAYAASFLNSSSSGELSAFPGYDPLKDHYQGPDTRFVTLDRGAGQTIQRDLADGRGADILTGDLDLLIADLGGFRIQNRLNFLTGHADTRVLVPAATPQAASAFRAAFDPNGVGGTFTFSATGQPLTDLTTPLFQAGFWTVDKDIDSIVNDLTVTRNLGKTNKLSVGLYAAKWSSDDYWNLGNAFLLTAEPRARRVDLMLNNGTRITRDGFTSGPFFQVNASWEGRTLAGYLLDEWQITPELRLDAGVRYESYAVDGTNEGVTFGVDLDGNPATAFNNATTILNDNFTQIDFNDSAWSWTAGLNYRFTDNFAAFLRANSGQKFPHFDDLRNGVTNLQNIDQYEIGLKARDKNYGVYATAFFNQFSGLPFTRFVNGVPVASIGDSEATGLELEGFVRPWGQGLELALSSTYQNSKFKNFGANSNNRVVRQPKFQLRFTPSYRFEPSWGSLEFSGTLTHIGKRFSDPENLQPLPAYTKVDAGIRSEVGRFTVQLTADNLTNELALTEGNVFIVGGQQGTIFARPLPGRTFTLSLAYAL